MPTLKQKLLRYKWWITLLIIIGFAGYLYFTKEEVSPFETVKAKRASVIQEVSVTGRVSSESEVELSFDRSGKVTRVAKLVGDTVLRGDIIATLDSSELSALRTQAKANLDYELVRLVDIRKGARPEDIAISESRVESAQQSLDDANLTLVSRLRESYTKADDAVRNLTDVLFQNARTANPTFLVPASDAKLLAEITSSRVSIESLLSSWNTLAQSLSETRDAGDDERVVEDSLEQLKAYLEKLALAVNTVVPSTSTSQASIDTWKAAVSTARSNINTTIANVLAANQAYRSAKSALVVASNELALKKAGATPEAVAAQEAKIAAMQATLENYEAQIAKFTLRSPIAGIITKQDAKLGQTAAANVQIATIQSSGKWKIEANIPEVDVAKISLGDRANITLDAFGSDRKLEAEVSQIDPAETIVEGVPTYKVTLRFVGDEGGVKSGMTANIDIRTAERDGVLSIPARAVLTRDDGKKIVRIPDGKNMKEVEVTVGLRGSDGTIEIVQGLSESDEVITFVKGS